MGLRMKGSNIFGVYQKIWFSEGVHEKPLYVGRGGGRLPEKAGGLGGAWTVCRFKWGGDWQEKGWGGVFEGEVETPMHTMHCTAIVAIM